MRAVCSIVERYKVQDMLNQQFTDLKSQCRGTKYISLTCDCMLMSHMTHICAGAPEPVRQVQQLPDQSLSQNGTQVHAHSYTMRISAGLSEIVCYSKCSTQCAGTCMTACPSIASGVLSEVLKSKIFLGEHAPSRRHTSYISFLCLPDQ